MSRHFIHNFVTCEQYWTRTQTERQRERERERELEAGWLSDLSDSVTMTDQTQCTQQLTSHLCSRLTTCKHRQ